MRDEDGNRLKFGRSLKRSYACLLEGLGPIVSVPCPVE
jgi:hypothetical protein